MIYLPTNPDDPIDQADIIRDCPIPFVTSFAPTDPAATVYEAVTARVVVLTQTCDLANTKVAFANVAVAFDAQFLIAEGVYKPADVKGSLRSGRIWGAYFLPADPAFGLPEMIVDLRRVHTVKIEHLVALAKAGKRPGRIQPLYREHLAKHFADTFSRIGLPRPIETL